VVVDDFNSLGVSVDKTKANTVLLIDSDRVLAVAVTRERFEAIARWKFEIVYADCGFN